MPRDDAFETLNVFCRHLRSWTKRAQHILPQPPQIAIKMKDAAMMMLRFHITKSYWRQNYIICYCTVKTNTAVIVSHVQCAIQQICTYYMFDHYFIWSLTI